MPSDVVSVRVPKELREKMRKYRQVNWKAVIIEAIGRKVRELEVREILSKIDEMNEGLRTSETPAWKDIRRDRNAGH